MRFSAAFSLPLPPAAVPAAEAARVRPQPPAPEAVDQSGGTGAAAADLPDDLDARVRLVGEWQLGEAAE